MGSKELLQPLRATGIRAELTTLDSADFAFEGNGPDAGTWSIGVERKTLPDLVASLQSGRLQGLQTEHGQGGQLGRLRQTYDLAWVLVEGQWTADRQGRICQKRRQQLHPVPGNMTEDGLAKRLLSLQLLGGILIERTRDTQHTVHWLASLMRWWTDKEWSEHKTLETTHRPQGLMPVSQFRQVAMTFPGVGLAASKALDAHYGGNLHDLLHTTIPELAAVQISTPAGPRSLGPAKAERVYGACRRLTGAN